MERKYKILAFIILVKKWRKNSFILSYENKVEYAANIGISYTSYKKYLNLAIEAGVIIKIGEHHQAIGFVKAIQTLGLNKKIKSINSIYNNYTYEQINFKSVYERIRESIEVCNFEKQQYIIERNRILFSKGGDDSIKKARSTIVKHLCRKAARNGIATDELINDIYQRKIDNIVTGKYHLANLTGFSPATGLRRLRRLHHKGTIERMVRIETIQCIPDFESYDYLRETIKETKMLPCREGFRLFLGSSVTLLKGKNEYIPSKNHQKGLRRVHL